MDEVLTLIKNAYPESSNEEHVNMASTIRTNPVKLREMVELAYGDLKSPVFKEKLVNQYSTPE